MGRARTGRRVWAALALAGLVELQGCGSLAWRGDETTIGTRLETVEGRAGLVGQPFPGARPDGGLQPTCGAMFSLSGGEGAALLGLLVLVAPFVIAYGVIMAPLGILTGRL